MLGSSPSPWARRSPTTALRRAGLLGAALLASAVCQAQSPAAEAAFVQEYRRAHESKNVEAAMKLVDWTGVEPKIKQMFVANFKDDFALPIDKLEMTAPASNQLTQYTREGHTYKTNLPVKKVLVVTFKAPPTVAQVRSTRYLVGDKGGRYYITTAVPVD